MTDFQSQHYSKALLATLLLAVIASIAVLGSRVLLVVPTVLKRKKANVIIINNIKKFPNVIIIDDIITFPNVIIIDNIKTFPLLHSLPLMFCVAENRMSDSP